MSYPVVPNIAAGRANELYRRVKVGDPSTSRIVVVAFKTMPTEAAVRDAETLAALITAGALEATNTLYTRKVFAAADLTAWAPEHASDRAGFDLPDINYGALGIAGAMAAIGVYYTPDQAGGADTDMVPLTFLTWTSVPDGISTVLFNWSAEGVYRGTPAA